VVKADEEVRARQASQAPEPPPGMAASPEAMPGMAAPPQQMMAMQGGPTPETQGPQAPRERVAQLLQALSAGGANAQG
jgi:hypothetical protein